MSALTRAVLGATGSAVLVGTALIALAPSAGAATDYVYLNRDTNGKGCRTQFSASVRNFKGLTYKTSCTNPTKYSLNDSVSSVINQTDCRVYMYGNAGYGLYDDIIEPRSSLLSPPSGHNDDYSSMQIIC